MGKKRVPISLRKPPSPDTVEAFVRGAPDATEGNLAAAAHVAHGEVDAEPAPDSGVVAHAPSEVPPPPDTSRGAPAAFAGHAVGDVLVGVDGAALRPVTIYLPAVFAEELAVYCAEVDRDASRVVRDALETHFRRQLGPATGGLGDAGPAPPEAGSAASSRPSSGRGAGPDGGWREATRAHRAQATAITLLDRALRVLEVGQALAMRLRVHVQRA